MNYQGCLTDQNGYPVADTHHSITFRIYDQNDIVRWEESQTVTTTGGCFSAQLGSNGSPLSMAIFDYAGCWLGITVDSTAEIAPRTRLISVPYSFRTGTVDGAEGGTITSDLTIAENLVLGDIGTAGSTSFRPHESGDSAVALPDDAVQSREILNEPGVAAFSGAYYVYLADTAYTVLCSLTIDCPADGYVMAVAHGRIATLPGHTTGTRSYATVGISNVPNALPGNQDLDFQIDSPAPSGVYSTPFGMTSMFTVPSAGSYTYYYLAYEYSGSITVADMQFNLVYFPTAYGQVDPVPPPVKTQGGGGSADLGGLTSPGGDGDRVDSESFDIDALERELAVLRARIEAIQQQIESNRNDRK